MRFVLLIVSLLGYQAIADVGDIQCFAHQYELSDGKLINEIKMPLIIEFERGNSVVYSVDIGARHFSLNGDVQTGDFLATQTWGEDYTYGIVATGTFDSTGRLQITLVEKTKIYKLVCAKTLASSFPNK
jgi:hypothetical protein